ncbi:MAG: YibE/F family protein [Faecousia sp.]
MVKKASISSGFPFRRILRILVLAILIGIGVLLYMLSHPAENTVDSMPSSGYVEYEKAVVTQILSDSCTPDPFAEGHDRGVQKITVEVLTGQYKGKVLLSDCTVGPIYGSAVSVGDRVSLAISTYSGGEIRAAVYEYDRSTAIFGIVALFLILTVLIGGKVGAKSLLGLALTVVALIWILIPLLLQGWPTVPTTLLVCSLLTCTCFVILGGMDRKTLCAILGTLAGIVLATLFGMAAQHFLRIDGYRQEYAEALLQLRQTGESAIGISGLVIAGVVISALGAVMDVAMSIASAMQELSAVGSNLTAGQLFRSGMNIGRDMVGTMSNTLILAIIGSGLTMIVYIYSLNLPVHEFMTSAFLSLEVISGVASSVGVILAVPLTAAISAFAFGYKPHSGK